MNDNNLVNLQQLFNCSLFRIPDYQRGYSWRNEQLEDFWDDLLSLLPGQDHYTGMLSLRVISKKEINDNPEKWRKEKWLSDAGYSINEIVDGQQRLTTLIILINEILDYYKTRGETSINTANKIQNVEATYISRQEEGDIIRTYIFGYEIDNPSYDYFRIKILNDPDKADVNETFYTLNLSNAKEFFKNKLEPLSEEEVRNIFTKITVNLKFNIYKIDNSFNVFVAFETMNNRGKRLSSLELLKNRLIFLTTLFGDNSEEDRATVRDEINETWKDIYGFLGKNKKHPLKDDDFLQHHWMIYFGYQTGKLANNTTISFDKFLLKKCFIQQRINHNSISPIELPSDEIQESSDESDELYENDDNIESENTDTTISTLTLKDIQDYVHSLRELIPYWYKTHISNNIENNELAKYVFRVNELDHNNARPLITVILSKEDIDDNIKTECIKKIERFCFINYKLGHYTSTYKSSVLYGLARDLYKNTITIEEVISTVEKFDSDFMSSNGVIIHNGPLDKFSKLMKKDGYYSWRALKYLLYIYDLYLSGVTPAKQKIDPDKYFGQDEKDMCSIEHIYPQTPTNKYWIEHFNQYDETDRKKLVKSLGNMLPLSLSINKSLQNMSFKDKKNGTEKRHGYINGTSSEMEVAKNDDWTPELILERGMTILKFMEDEFNFKFPNDEYRKRILGLDFLVKDDDQTKNCTEQIINNEEKPNEPKVFDEETFKKLSAQAGDDLMYYYLRIHEYCCKLSDTSTAYTTPNYIAYTDKTVFVELHFHKDRLHLLLCDTNYDDPQNKTNKLGNNYNWSKNTVLDIFPGDDLEYIKNLIKQSYDFSISQ